MLCARRRRMDANLVDHGGKLTRGEWFRNANCGAVTTSNRGQLRAGQSDYRRDVFATTQLLDDGKRVAVLVHIDDHNVGIIESSADNLKGAHVRAGAAYSPARSRRSIDNRRIRSYITISHKKDICCHAA
jgi:hypothetical protein